MAERHSRYSRHLRLDPYTYTYTYTHTHTHTYLNTFHIHNILDEYDSEDLDDTDEDLDDPILYQDDLGADIEESDDESIESDVGDDNNPALGEGDVIFGCHNEHTHYITLNDKRIHVSMTTVLQIP